MNNFWLVTVLAKSSIIEFGQRRKMFWDDSPFMSRVTTTSTDSIYWWNDLWKSWSWANWQWSKSKARDWYIFNNSFQTTVLSLSQSNMQVNAIQQLWVIVFQRLDKRAKERRHKKRSQMTCSLKYNNFLPPLNFSQFTVKVIT